MHQPSFTTLEVSAKEGCKGCELISDELGWVATQIINNSRDSNGDTQVWFERAAVGVEVIEYISVNCVGVELRRLYLATGDGLEQRELLGIACLFATDNVASRYVARRW